MTDLCHLLEKSLYTIQLKLMKRNEKSPKSSQSSGVLKGLVLFLALYLMFFPTALRIHCRKNFFPPLPRIISALPLVIHMYCNGKALAMNTLFMHGCNT